MSIELKVPSVGESVTEVQIGKWLKNEGSAIKRDEAAVTIESDKATVEVSAPEDAVISRILKKEGENAHVGEPIAVLETNGKARQKEEKPAAVATPSSPPPLKREGPLGSEEKAAPLPKQNHIMPAAQRAIDETGVSAEKVEATGPGGKILKEDVLREAARESATAHPPLTPARPEEEVVRMSPMRRTIGERLVEAQRNAALLTSFNEIDMSATIALRKKHQEEFQKRYGTKLGFMSFFVKAAVDALKLIPACNAEIQGDNIIYRNHYDIGIAVGGGKGLVVPVLKDAEHLSFSEIEKAIDDFAKRAKENKVELHELQGGTFTISNGGIYGSLLSTPIVNPPQSAILGLHVIQDRPVAVDGQVVVRPMMYIALTYDHRIIDGREAVTFLKRIKECIEEPSRMLVEV
jgi:2-oxoglutarate dehydrogenase E2 component (dihydrolipoamide succinyltransferase)